MMSDLELPTELDLHSSPGSIGGRKQIFLGGFLMCHPFRNSVICRWVYRAYIISLTVPLISVAFRKFSVHFVFATCLPSVCDFGFGA